MLYRLDERQAAEGEQQLEHHRVPERVEIGGPQGFEIPQVAEAVDVEQSGFVRQPHQHPQRDTTGEQEEQQPVAAEEPRHFQDTFCLWWSRKYRQVAASPSRRLYAGR